MSINQRQFEILTEIGISLWQRRTLTSQNHNNNDSAIKVDAVQPNLSSHNASILTQQQFFKDILLSLNLSINAVKTQNNALDLGLFTWQFIEGDSIVLKQGCLTTPKLTIITQSPQLKRALWHAIEDVRT